MQSDTNVPLRILIAEPAWVWVRSQVFSVGLFMVILFPVIGIIQLLNKTEWWVPWIGFGPALFGLLLVILGWKQKKWARFFSDSGIVVLDVVQSGPDKDQFDSFVQKIVEQIAKARANN